MTTVTAIKPNTEALSAQSVAPLNMQVNIQNNTQPEIAEVASIDNKNRISEIQCINNNTRQKIIAQAQHITPASIGDSIVVQQTQQGWIVIAQLADENSSPTAHITDNNGHVKVTAAKSVTLATQKGTIEVHENGTIVLDATELNATSERDFTIAGWPIRLN